MKNICKVPNLLLFMLAAATLITNAQSNNSTGNSSTVKQETAQQAPAQKFFNVQSLDDLKTGTDAAYSNYKQATTEKAEALQLEYLKAKRLYTVELEKQMSSFSKESVTGQKIRTELRRISTAE